NPIGVDAWVGASLVSLVTANPWTKRDLFPFAVAIVTFGLVAVVGAAPASGLRTYLVMAIIAALGLVVIARRLSLGVAALPLVAAVIPVTIGTGTSSPIVAALMFSVLLISLWIVRAIVAHDFMLVGSPA